MKMELIHKSGALVTPSGLIRHYSFSDGPQSWRASPPVVMAAGRLNQLMGVVDDVRRRSTALLAGAETEPSACNKENV